MLRLAVVQQSSSAAAYLRLAPRLVKTELVEYATIDDLLANPARFDAVLLGEDEPTAFAAALKLAQAGKHVLLLSVEPPSLAVAEQLVEACRAAEVRLMLGFAARFLPSIRTLKEAHETGRLGELGLLRIHRWNARSAHRALLEIATLHELDLACWFFGATPEVIYALDQHSSSDAAERDYVQIHLGFAQAGMALVDVAHSLPPGDDYYSLSIVGSAGSAYADDHHNAQLLYAGGHPQAIVTGQGDRQRLALLAEFQAAIHERREPRPGGGDWLQTLRVAESFKRSLVESQAVSR